MFSISISIFTVVMLINRATLGSGTGGAKLNLAYGYQRARTGPGGESRRDAMSDKDRALFSFVMLPVWDQ